MSKIGPLSRPNRGPLQDIDAYLEAAGRGAHDVLKHSRGCALVEYRYAVCCDRAVTVWMPTVIVTVAVGGVYPGL